MPLSSRRPQGFGLLPKEPSTSAWNLAFWALILIIGVQCGPKQSANPNLSLSSPDILFIVADDLNTRIGCYGDPVARTPNLDKLAGNAIQFLAAYCQYPACNPSRASVLSGLNPPTTGVLSNRQDWRKPLRDTPLLPDTLRENGYTTVRIGKILHKGSQGEKWGDKGHWDEAIDVQNRKFRLKLRGPSTPSPNTTGTPLRWGSSGDDPSRDHDALVADQAIEQLKKDHARPLFLALSFSSTHLPFAAPKSYMDLFAPEEMKIEAAPQEDLSDTYHLRATDDRVLTRKERQEIRAAYYSCVSFLDHQVGRVLDALDRLGKRESTLIILWSDHGMHQGEHRQWRKDTLFEEATRVPLFVDAPGSSPGRSCTELVELVDLYPTILDLCHLPSPPGLEGKSFGHLLSNAKGVGKTAAYTYRYLEELQRLAISVRTSRYRYTHSGEGEIELYDHVTDPGEFTNLANSPDHQAILAELSALAKKR